MHPKELEVILKLSEFPAAIEAAATDYSPAVVAQYVYDLAKAYNGFYQEVPIFSEEETAVVKMRVFTVSGKKYKEGNEPPRDIGS